MTDKERNERAQVIAKRVEEFKSDLLRHVYGGLADNIGDDYELLTHVLEYYIWKDKEVTALIWKGEDHD
jgi:hypothetical protein